MRHRRPARPGADAPPRRRGRRRVLAPLACGSSHRPATAARRPRCGCGDDRRRRPAATGDASGELTTLTHRLQRLAGLVPAGRRRRGGPLRRGRPRRRPQVLRRLHRVARRAGRRPARRQRPDAERHDLRRRRPGAEQKIVVANDNSTGNDAVICDESIKIDRRPEGQDDRRRGGRRRPLPAAAGPGQGGHDRGRHQLPGRARPTPPPPRSPAASSTASPSSPRSPLQALERPGSHVLFSSKDFPGAIPDHLVATADAADERRGDMQKLVDAWYATLDYIKANPDEATKIMADKAGVSVERVRVASPTAPRCSPPTRRSTPSPTAPATRPRCRDGPPDQPVPRQLRPDREGGRPDGLFDPRSRRPTSTPTA